MTSVPVFMDHRRKRNTSHYTITLTRLDPTGPKPSSIKIYTKFTQSALWFFKIDVFSTIMGTSLRLVLMVYKTCRPGIFCQQCLLEVVSRPIGGIPLPTWLVNCHVTSLIRLITYVLCHIDTDHFDPLLFRCRCCSRL